MKDTTTEEMEIKRKFPDMMKMTVEFDVILSKQEIEKRGRDIAVSLQTYMLRYEHHAQEATFYFSDMAKDVVMKLKEEQQVKFIQRDVAGKIIPGLCRTGKLVALDGVLYVTYVGGDASVVALDGVLYVTYIGGDACVRVNFNDESDWYAIYNLEFLK